MTSRLPLHIITHTHTDTRLFAVLSVFLQIIVAPSIDGIMVSSIVGMRSEDLGPGWLKPLLRGDYFIPCSIHADSNKSECNFFCLDCVGNPLCSYCCIHHKAKAHRLVQIRRSSYHNVVRVNEIQRYVDISCIQTYVINSAKIVFLNGRPQPRAGKGVTSTCQICHRGLPDSFRFCSLGCKLNGMKRGDSLVTLSVKHKQFDDESESDNESTFVSHGDDNLSPPTPPPYNHTNSSRRKGVPHRAPF